MVGGVALFFAAAAGYWAHPFASGPLRGSVHTGGAQNVECMKDVGSTRFTVGGISLWNVSKGPIEIKRVELDLPVGVRMGSAFVVGIVNQTMLGSSARVFPPPTANQDGPPWAGMDPRPVGAVVIPPSTREVAYELLVELDRTKDTGPVSVDAVKIEYATGWRRPYWTKSTVRTLIRAHC